MNNNSNNNNNNNNNNNKRERKNVLQLHGIAFVQLTNSFKEANAIFSDFIVAISLRNPSIFAKIPCRGAS